MTKVLIVGAEGAPFAKTGGLADVIGALPAELQKQGTDVRVVMPLHGCIRDKYRHQLEVVATMNLTLGWRTQFLGVETLELDGIRYYFIDNEYYFAHCIYKGGDAEVEQYAYFCRAVLEAISHIDFIPDVIHVNDWHTAMIPMLLRAQYAQAPFGGAKTVLTIHNLQYQGKLAIPHAKDLLGLGDEYFTADKAEAYGCANMMKAGILYADKVTTVSPSYAQEILDPYFGRGMEGVLAARRNDLVGIVNGINTVEFDPMHDQQIAVAYDATCVPRKYENKVALLNELNLPVQAQTPMIGMVTRLTEQKGLDLVRAVLEEMLCHDDISFVLLGSGDQEYEDFFRYIATRYPHKASVTLGYSDALAHRIYAGCDFLLMPSQFEPCGLSQMIAQRYGTLPIVRETGGLRDTVHPYNIYTREGSGFSFTNYNAHDMLNTIRFACKVFKDKVALSSLIAQTMQIDNSFAKSAAEYIALYESMLH